MSQEVDFVPHEPKLKKRKPLRSTECEKNKNENEEIKFLEVLSVLLNKNENENEKDIDGDAVDGITDSILSIAQRLPELLECDFDNLELQRKVITVLRKLKAITDFFNVKKSFQTSEIYKWQEP